MRRTMSSKEFHDACERMAAALEELRYEQQKQSQAAKEAKGRVEAIQRRITELGESIRCSFWDQITIGRAPKPSKGSKRLSTSTRTQAR